MSFSVPRCNNPNWGSTHRRTSPLSCIWRRKIPCAAGCCGPKAMTPCRSCHRARLRVGPTGTHVKVRTPASFNNRRPESVRQVAPTYPNKATHRPAFTKEYRRLSSPISNLTKPASSSKTQTKSLPTGSNPAPPPNLCYVLSVVTTYR